MTDEPVIEADMRDTTSSAQAAYILTGPTSGFGYRTALELAAHGTVILVGRDRAKLADVEQEIERRGHHAVAVQCDLADLESVRAAAQAIVDTGLPLAGLINNAGVMDLRGSTNGRGWDLSFATNHVGPFALTEALIPHLPDGATVVLLASGVEDPERGPAKTAGFRGGRYISADASARGEWIPDGAKQAGYDAYATSKQAALASLFALARETPRLHFVAIEPGFAPATGLGRDANAAIRFLGKYVLGAVAPLIKYWSTPGRAAKVITRAAVNADGASGIYYDENGRPMQASTLASSVEFQDRVAAETRALLNVTGR